MPVRGDFVDCEESLCAIFDRVGELIERLFREVGAGVETRVYVVDGVDVCETVVGISLEVDEVLFEEFHAGDEFGGEGSSGSFIVP